MTSRLIAQLKQRFASEVLWHFVGRTRSDSGRYEDLLSILRQGLQLGKGKEEFRFYCKRTKKWRSLEGYPAVCLADIPLKDLHIHAVRYGEYAIGFHKESVIRYGFNPVLYANQHSGVFHDFIFLRDRLEDRLRKLSVEAATDLQKLLLLLGTVTKAGNLQANPVADIDWDKAQVNNFYYEREWRHVLPWPFQASDVAMVILPDRRITDFLRDRKSSGLKIDERTPVLPYSMIYRL